jgi:hypothetical protein
MLKSCSSFRPSWTRHRFVRPFVVNAVCCSAWMRAARLYGPRGGLVMGLLAKCLETLVHANLPESVRLEAEQMLEDGKTVTSSMLKRMVAQQRRPSYPRLNESLPSRSLPAN